jgi:chlorophyllide a reductase subunit X
MFEQLAQGVADAPPVRPKPLTQDGLLGLFKGDTVGRNIVLEPATQEDMCGARVIEKPSLEVVYEAI